MGRDKAKDHRRSDKETEPFLLLRRSLIHSPQFAALSTPARSLIFELHAMYNGTNNGTVFLSVRDAAARLGFCDLKAAMRAFNELTDIGWLTETIAGSFAVKTDVVSRARAWHLNWIVIGRCAGPDALPPLDFKRLSATQKRRVRERQATLEQYAKTYLKNKIAVEESSTLDARQHFAGQLSVEESLTLKSGNGGKPPNSIVRESTTHIHTMGIGDESDRQPPFTPEIAGGPSSSRHAEKRRAE